MTSYCGRYVHIIGRHVNALCMLIGMSCLFLIGNNENIHSLHTKTMARSRSCRSTTRTTRMASRRILAKAQSRLFAMGESGLNRPSRSIQSKSMAGLRARIGCQSVSTASKLAVLTAAVPLSKELPTSKNHPRQNVLSYRRNWTCVPNGHQGGI